jgi:hypothetical protein
MLGALVRSVSAVLGLVALAACTGGRALENLPASMGGLPAGAPARPETPYEYPAVHDMPPPRATTPLTEEEQLKAEKELQAARDRQEGAVKKPAPGAKKKPAGGATGQNTGAKTSP